MTARLAADALVALHFAFIAFVIAGGFLTFRHRGWALVHLPAVAWAAWTEFTATVCPLTPWENAFRAGAGDAGYTESFVEHYIVPLVYPQGLTPQAQVGLGDRHRRPQRGHLRVGVAQIETRAGLSGVKSGAPHDSQRTLAYILGLGHPLAVVGGCIRAHVRRFALPAARRGDSG